MAKTIETKTETITDPPKVEKLPPDPNVQIMKLKFWARLVISLLAFSLFGYLVITMINKPDELAQSSKDLINLAFGAFLPIIGMLGKHWFESAHESIGNDNNGPTLEQRVDITTPKEKDK
tara:strand:- start:950 stop:1309 length:360 start_codon:yes stop_codon:yes gene_type:complete